MVIYYLFKGTENRGYSKLPFMATESIKEARLKAIKFLIKNDKKGQMIGITKKPTDDPWSEGVGAVMMLATGVHSQDTYFEKPSVALKKGYKFSAVSNGGIYYILKDGSLGELHAYN